MEEEITNLCSQPIKVTHYIDSKISPEDSELLKECEKRYSSLYEYYRNKYKRIKRRKIALDLTLFIISSGGIVGSITFTSLIGLITIGGIILNKLVEQLKYNKKLVLIKKIINELKSIINDIEGYKRGNDFNKSKFLERMNSFDRIGS